jgi:hypothetical protein
MDRVKVWRGIALGMTALAMTSIAMTLVGASSPTPTPVNQTPQDKVVDSRQYEWRGAIYWNDLEGGFWAIKTECGVWGLTTEDADLLDKIKKHEGMMVEIWGTVFDGATITMVPTIKVDSVFGEGDVKPQTLVAIPDYCETHGQPTPPDSKPPYPTYPGYYYYPGANFSYVLTNILQSLIGNQGYPVDPDAAFDTFVGVEITTLDKDGKEIVVEAKAGVVVSNDGKALVIEQNGPDGTARYSLSGVKVVRANGGDAGSIKEGDKVVVVSKDGKSVVVIASMQVTMWPEYYPEPRPLPAWDSGTYPAGEVPAGADVDHAAS